jgi:hypothetical protein
MNFLNSWLGLLDLKHLVWKNHKTQFSINQMLEDETEKIISIIQKNSR